MDRKMLWVGVGLLFLIGTSGLLTVLLRKPANFRGTAYVEPYPLAPEIELRKAGGEPFLLSDLKDKIILLFFGYTSCPDVCPTTLAELNIALTKIKQGAQNVQVVFISIDPQRDTPEKIQEYASRFGESFIGLSGSMEELEPIWRNYGVFREIAQDGTAMDYIVNHTARVTLIDRRGYMRLSYGFQTPPEDIANDIDILLDE